MTILRALAVAAIAAAALSTAGCKSIGNAQTNLRTAIDTEKPSLDTCYEEALTRDESLSGTMTIWVHVTESGGAVDSVEVIESTVNDPALTKCVETTLVGLTIDPKPKASLKVEYELRFSPKA